MPIVMVSSAPSREMYERVAREALPDGDRPRGMIVHAASEAEDGSVQIIDVWQSPEDLQRFGEERLFPAFEAAGVAEQVRQQGPPVPREPFHYIG